MANKKIKNNMEKLEEKVETISAKYIFLDVVGFTRNRSVEAQSDIVKTLNKIIVKSIKNSTLSSTNYIFIPTGDGICICIMNIEKPFDVHIQIALNILKNLEEYNLQSKDNARKFKIRIGIASGVDNLIIDINHNKNVAGATINNASRVMDLADGGQILVDHSTYTTLLHREKYMKFFRKFKAKIKHGFKLSVYQYIDRNNIGLNTDKPKVFCSIGFDFIKMIQRLYHLFIKSPIKTLIFKRS